MRHDPQRARAVAEAAIRSAAEVKNDPPDLINVALEMLVKASLELPAFSTLDEIASRVRLEVNTGMFDVSPAGSRCPTACGLENLLDVVGPAVKTPFNRLKQPAGKASWSGFREQVEHLAVGRLARRYRGVAGGDRGVEDRRLRRGGDGC